MANFGPLSRGQPQSPDVNHCISHIPPEGHQEPREVIGNTDPYSVPDSDFSVKIGDFSSICCPDSQLSCV